MIAHFKIHSLEITVKEIRNKYASYNFFMVPSAALRLLVCQPFLEMAETDLLTAQWCAMAATEGASEDISMILNISPHYPLLLLLLLNLRRVWKKR